MDSSPKCFGHTDVHFKIKLKVYTKFVKVQQLLWWKHTYTFYYVMFYFIIVSHNIEKLQLWKYNQFQDLNTALCAPWSKWSLEYCLYCLPFWRTCKLCTWNLYDVGKPVYLKGCALQIHRFKNKLCCSNIVSLRAKTNEINGAS